MFTILPHYLLWPAGEESHEVDRAVDLALAVLAEAPVNLVPAAEVQDVVEELVADVDLFLWGALAETVACMEIVIIVNC